MHVRNRTWEMVQKQLNIQHRLLRSAISSHLEPGLAALFKPARDRDGEKTAILPLPVCLFVEEAVRLVNSGRSLEELPQSLPDVYTSNE
jgi:hypothetical protein